MSGERGGKDMTEKVERCIDCGSAKVTNHKLWCGDLLPMCLHCFEAYIRKGREATR